MLLASDRMRTEDGFQGQLLREQLCGFAGSRGDHLGSKGTFSARESIYESWGAQHGGV